MIDVVVQTMVGTAVVLSGLFLLYQVAWRIGRWLSDENNKDGEPSDYLEEGALFLLVVGFILATIGCVGWMVGGLVM